MTRMRNGCVSFHTAIDADEVRPRHLLRLLHGYNMSRSRQIRHVDFQAGFAFQLAL